MNNINTNSSNNNHWSIVPVRAMGVQAGAYTLLLLESGQRESSDLDVMCLTLSRFSFLQNKMLTLCREAWGLDGHLPTLPGACGPPPFPGGRLTTPCTAPPPGPAPCALATPLRALCLCFWAAVHPVEHPQERPEGVRVRPAHRRHGPLCAVRLQRLQAGPGASGPTLRFRLGGQLHADVFCHGGRHLQGTWGPGGWQGGSSLEAWAWLSSSPVPVSVPAGWPWRRLWPGMDSIWASRLQAGSGETVGTGTRWPASLLTHPCPLMSLPLSACLRGNNNNYRTSRTREKGWVLVWVSVQVVCSSYSNLA